MITAPPPATKMLPVSAPYMATYSLGFQCQLNTNAKRATASTADLSRRSCARGDIGRLRNGSTMSCTAMLAHECM